MMKTYSHIRRQALDEAAAPDTEKVDLGVLGESEETFQFGRSFNSVEGIYRNPIPALDVAGTTVDDEFVRPGKGVRGVVGGKDDVADAEGDPAMVAFMPSMRSRALSAPGSPTKPMHLPPSGIAFSAISPACLPASVFDEPI